MNRKFKDALKKAYNIPEPSGKDVFLQNIESKSHRQKLTYFPVRTILRYAAVPLTALALLGVYGMYDLLSDSRTDFVIEMPVSTTTETNLEDLSSEGDTPDQICAQISTIATDVSLPETEISVQTKTEITTAPAEIKTETSTSTWISTTNDNEIQTADTRTQTQTRTTTAPPVSASAEPTTTTLCVSSVTHVSSASATAPSKTVTQTTTDTTCLYQTVPPAPATTVMRTTAPIQYEPVATTSTEMNEPVTDPQMDYRITPAFQYAVTDKILELEHASSDIPDNSPYLWTNTAYKSDWIVSGVILSVFYTSIDGMPWTQLDILIEDDRTHQFFFGDMISLYLPGGYMPLSDYIEQNSQQDAYSHMTASEIAETTLFDSNNRIVFPTEGERYLFFLKNGSDTIPDGAFECADAADRSLYLQDGSNYTFAWDRTSVIFTEKELQSFLTLR